MDFLSLKEMEIPDGIVKKIESNGVVLWEEPSSYSNQVPISIDTSGGIYNGVGYKHGYRVSSSGSEKENGDLFCTGFIPCKSSDVIRFCFASGSPIWTDNSTLTSMTFFDSSKSCLGQFTSQPAYYGIFSDTSEVNNVQKNGDVWEYTVPNNDDISFVRFSVPYTSQNNYLGGEDLIITVNEEIS